MRENYAYQVARVRVRELSLLNSQDIELLMSCKTSDECIRVLRDKGWGDGTEKTAEEIFSNENAKTQGFIHELLDDLSVFDVLLYPTDFNNLKAAIKLGFTGQTPHNVFKKGGTVDPELIMKAVSENDFSILPDFMAETGKKAMSTILRTRDGQLCDIIIDRACLEAVRQAGLDSDEGLVRNYADLSVAISDIKIAVRCQKTGKSQSFINEALAPCDSLNISALSTAAAKSLDEVLNVLSLSPYASCVDKLKESPSAFEKWCDDRMTDLIKEQKSNPFTLGPIMAYSIARQNEINTVRIILSGKLNNIDDSIIRERLRAMYV